MKISTLVFIVQIRLYSASALGAVIQNSTGQNVASGLPVPIKIHTCCPIDLTSKEPVRCKKPSPEDEIIPSESVMIPMHLMAENRTNTFQLDVRKAPCVETDIESVYLPWTFSSLRESLFLKNGYLKLDKEYFHIDEYCINGKTSTTLEISVCPQDCLGKRPCIRKCCGLEKVYSFGFSSGNAAGKGCQNPGSVDYFKPTFYSDFVNQASDIGALEPHYIEKYPSTFKYECHNNKTGTFVFPKVSLAILNNTGGSVPGLAFRLREDGKILYTAPDGKCEVVDPDKFHICIDGVMNYEAIATPYLNDPVETVLFMCAMPPPEGNSEYGGYLYGGLMIASSVFLLLTIAVYLLLWERQTVHGWTILSHVLSLFCMYIFLGTAHLIRVTMRHDSINTTWCWWIGVLAHFFFLATFCWLSIISLDLWLTFRAITPRRGTKSKGLSRYIKYSIVGWGCPLLFIVVGWFLTAEYQENTCSKSEVLSPAYGVYSCFLQEKAFGVYIYYPIAVMMILNILFFGITSVKLYMYRNSTKMATKDDTQQQFYRLFFKLFFVMGVLYIFELVSWFVSGTGFFWYWVVFDVLNILRAVAVFVIFVCKPDIIWALEQNYPCLKPVLIPFACVVRERRSFAQRTAETESIGLNSTKQSTMRSTTTTSA